MAQPQWSVTDVCSEMRDCKALLETRQGTSPSSEFLERIKDTISFKLRSLPQLSAAEALQMHQVLREVDLGEPVAAALSEQIDEKLLQKSEQTTVVSLKQQSLTNMHLFLTAQDWALLEGDGADWWAKQRCIVQRLKKLGVKSLAESTVRSCVSILLSTLTVATPRRPACSRSGVQRLLSEHGERGWPTVPRAVPRAAESLASCFAAKRLHGGRPSSGEKHCKAGLHCQGPSCQGYPQLPVGE